VDKDAPKTPADNTRRTVYTTKFFYLQENQ